jgi:hypothetical protein
VSRKARDARRRREPDVVDEAVERFTIGRGAWTAVDVAGLALPTVSVFVAPTGIFRGHAHLQLCRSDTRTVDA